MNRLDGKFSIVTGGTQGLGAAVARRFAEAGAAGIVTCGRSLAKGEAVAADIEKATGVPILFVAGDLASVDDCRAIVAAADEAFGRVDILVNAAGISDRGTILDTSPELFDTMFAVNLRGPFFLMQDAIKIMIREAIAGAVVNIGSMAAVSGQPFIVAYAASKGALATLTRNTAFALLRNRIRVNQLNIGWMASEGEDRIQRAYHGAGDDWRDKAAAELPFGRLVDPQEVARAVTFIASDDAGLMTGAVIEFDQAVAGAWPFAPPAPAEAMSLKGS
jgi:NAD(P)-dependent dehydrogenase (short-subunit alcohol dehydrogenase family)